MFVTFYVMFRLLLNIIFLCLLSVSMNSQVVYYHLSNTPVYDFLDELAAEQVIELTSMVKPYSRTSIAEKLYQADTLRNLLNKQEISELDFYLRDFNKERYFKGEYKKRTDLFHYKDSTFNFTINPILGTDTWYNENGFFYHWWNGLEAWAYVGNWSFYANIRDNHESKQLTARDYMNQRTGAANIKTTSDGTRDYEEIRGGIAYEWKCGSAGLFMDQFAWGENYYGSNILSGRTPSFARFELNLNPADWFEFHYVHGSLISEVVDSVESFWSTSSYGSDFREVYHPKFLAANVFTFTPIRKLQLSAGNSVIYDYRSPHIAYLIPVMFWKAIDHTLNARIENMNSQMFFSVSSRNIRSLHLHSTVFIDELKTSRFFDPDEYNLWSLKIGARFVPSALFSIPNISIFAEYTFSNTLTFMHYVPTTTFESNQYNLGHYLEDNARDLYLALQVKPWRTLRVKLYLNNAQKGPDHTELGTEPRAGIKPYDPIVWKSNRTGLLVSGQIINDLYFRLGYEWREVSGEEEYINRWTPEVYRGKTNTFSFGVNFGF